MKIKNDNITKNQIIVVSEIADNENKNIIKSYLSENFENFKEMMISFKSKLKKDSSIKIENEIVYLSMILNILGLSTEGKNNTTESICQQIFPMSYLKKLLENSKEHWILRKNILYFISNVYLDSELNFFENCIEIILQVFIHLFY